MDETLKELFEACRNGDLTKIKKLITPDNINAQDILGRKSTPLHFSSGMMNSGLFFGNKFCL
jgi:tankyrase